MTDEPDLRQVLPAPVELVDDAAAYQLLEQLRWGGRCAAILSALLGARAELPAGSRERAQPEDPHR